MAGLADLVEPVLAGNRRALARAITSLEDDGPEARDLLAALYPYTGRAHVIGITGAPGTGKSTLASALTRVYRAAGQTVAIVAVDPTSPFSGGALLGDRARMTDLAGDPGVFIRSMATRGSLGGLAHATHDVILLLDAAGFDRILVETVGVGQAEVDIARAAHTTVVVEAPGLGDELQAIKAGVLEAADIFAVNKADRDGADQTVSALQMLQDLAPPDRGRRSPGTGAQPTVRPQPDGVWVPPILKTVATRGEGVQNLKGEIEAHRAHLHRTGGLAAREAKRAATSLDHVLCHQLRVRMLASLPEGLLDGLVTAIARRELDPYTAAHQILASIVYRRSFADDP